MRKWIFYTFDLSVVALSPFVAIGLRHNFAPPLSVISETIPYATVGVLAASLVFLVAETHKGIWRYVSLPDFSRIVTAATAIVLIASFIVFSFNRAAGVARSIPLIQWAFIIAVMILARITARAFFRRYVAKSASTTSLDRENILVVGLNQVAELYLRGVANLASDKVVIAGLLDEASNVKGRRLHDYKVLGSPSDLSKILALLNIHGVAVKRVVITTPFVDLADSSRDELLKLERAGVIKLDFFARTILTLSKLIPT